jgi:hypothetical protein
MLALLTTTAAVDIEATVLIDAVAVLDLFAVAELVATADNAAEIPIMPLVVGTIVATACIELTAVAVLTASVLTVA